MKSAKPIYLRTARQRRKWTQEQLEERAQVAQTTIHRLETDEDARPAYRTVIALSRALGVDAAQLRFGPPPKERLAYFERRRARRKAVRRPRRRKELERAS